MLAVLLVALLATATWGAVAEPHATAAPGVAWTVDRPGDGASPRGVTTVDRPDGAAAAVVFDTRVELQAADGTLLWSATGLPVHGNNVAAAELTGDDTEDVLVATAAIFEPPARLTLLDGRDGAVLWSVPTGGAQVNDIAVAGSGPNAVVTIAAMPALNDGRVEAYHAGTGDALWSEPAGEVVTALSAFPAVTAAGTQNGRLLRFETLTGTALPPMELAMGGFVRDLVPVEGSVAGVTLVVVGDRAVMGLAGVAAADLVNVPLTHVWTYRADARFWSGTSLAAPLPVGGTTVFVNAWDGAQVHALDAESGSALWTAGDGGIRTSLSFLSPRSITTSDLTGDGAPEVIAAGATNGTAAFDAATGAFLWRAPTPGPTDWISAVPAEGGTRIVATHPYWFVGAYDTNGGLAWSHDYSVHQAGTAHDLDGDGTSDAVVSTAGHVYVIDGATGAERLRLPMWPLLANAVTTNVAVADLTGDGTADLIASARTGTMRGVVAAFDGATGGPLWTTYADYIIGGVTGRLIVHDVNDDNVPDVVFGSNKGHPSHVIAASGQDGATLWRYHVQDDVLDLELAQTADGPRIVLLRDHTSCGCFVHRGLVALEPGDGSVVWTRDVTDNRAADLAVSHDATSGTDRIIVRDADDPPDDGVPLAGDGPRFAYIDPTTGAELRRILLSSLGAPPLDAGPFFITGDVDGDATDDLVMTLREPRGRDADTQVVVLSGADDSVVWTSDVRSGSANILSMTAPGPSGGADVLAAWSGGTIARLDAASGSFTWQHSATGIPTWFLASGASAGGGELVFAPQGTRLQALTGA